MYLLVASCHSRQASVGPSSEFLMVPEAADDGTAKVSPIQGHIQMPSRLPVSLNGQILGLAENADGSLWIATSDHVLQLNQDAFLSDVLTDEDVHEYGLADGLHGSQGEKRHPCVVTDSLGRVWFSMNHGLSVVDPAPLTGRSLPTLVRIEIVPAFWQTWWFRLSCLLTGGLVAVGLYRLRMHRLARQLNIRFEERLAERTRIAHELHDTLLQGFLSASMQLHVAADRVPEDSPAKPLMDRVLQLMERVIQEGRDAVRGLRSNAGGSQDLGQAFSRVQEELAIQRDIDFRVLVEGRTRPLNPLIRDEIYRIGREALVNAFRHSRARKIEVELEYAARQLRILVRDNGCGIDPKVLRAGRDGHWGLTGMRERSERIGARFKVWSRAAAGTEVELSVPGHIAFQSQPSNRRQRWLAGLFHRQKELLNVEVRGHKKDEQSNRYPRL